MRELSYLEPLEHLKTKTKILTFNFNLNSYEKYIEMFQLPLVLPTSKEAVCVSDMQSTD